MTAGAPDPTVRGLLREFLSPAVADRWASVLQPVAAADVPAALTGAVAALRDGYGVGTAALAVVLVERLDRTVDETAELLAVPAREVDAALADPDADLPERLRRPRPQDLPATLRAATGIEAPRRRRWPIVVATVAGLAVALGLAGVVVDARRASTGDGVDVGADEPTGVDAPGGADDGAVGTPSPPVATADPTPSGPTPSGPTTPDPTRPDPGPSPTEPQPAETVIESLRFVDDLDVTTGTAGPALRDAPLASGVRLFGELSEPARTPLLVTTTFTAPDGRRSVRPLLVPVGLSAFAVSLPAELGEAPGRWLAVAEVDGATSDPTLAEVLLVATGG